MVMSCRTTGKQICALQGELLRLREILVRFPTTETEDRALLESKSLVDWREQVLVRFRILRKEALRVTIEGLEKALGIPAMELGLQSDSNLNSNHISSRLTDTNNEL